MKHSIEDISKKLAERAFTVARMLLPGGKQHGQLFEVGGVDGNAGKSLKVHLDGAHMGRWKDWAGDEGGDLLDLWASVRGIGLPEAFRQAKQYLGIAEEVLHTKTYPKPAKEHAELSATGTAMQWLSTVRKIAPAIVNRYRVRGSKEHKAVVFPSYSPSGTLLNHSYRTLDAEKKVWQEKGCAPSLWGWQGVSAKVWETREILICEGQIDAMTWAQWGIEAVSIPNGGGRTWIDFEWNNLEVFKTIFLSFDNDGKSDDNLHETILRLGKHRCRIVRFEAKDANAALQAGATASDAARWVAEAKYVPMPEIVLPTSFEAQVLERFYPTREDADGWTVPVTVHRNPRKSFRFRNAELTLWTGTTGHGKSTLLNSVVAMLAANCGDPSLIISLETAPTEIIYRQMQAAFVICNHADVKRCLAALDGMVLFYNKVGSISRQKLFEVMTYARARYGVRHIVIDSMMRVEGMEEDYPAQTALVIELVTFSRETECHVHLVAHPRKSAGDASPKSQDIAGSGNIRNNADNVMVMWRNIEKERDAEDGKNVDDLPDAVLSVEKDRMIGEFRKFPLSYNAARFRFESWGKIIP